MNNNSFLAENKNIMMEAYTLNILTLMIWYLYYVKEFVIFDTISAGLRNLKECRIQGVLKSIHVYIYELVLEATSIHNEVNYLNETLLEISHAGSVNPTWVSTYLLRTDGHSHILTYTPIYIYAYSHIHLHSIALRRFLLSRIHTGSDLATQPLCRKLTRFPGN